MSLQIAFLNNTPVQLLNLSAYTADFTSFAPPTAGLSVQNLNSCASDESLIKQAEGFRSCKYVDTTGNRTICYGYNLERTSTAEADMRKLGVSYSAVLSGSKCLSESQCTVLLQSELNKARNSEAAVFGNSVSCGCAKSVLVDMSYNLGSLSGFPTFDSYIKSGQWVTAANDLAGTLWCRQVGNRCTRNMAQIKQC